MLSHLLPPSALLLSLCVSLCLSAFNFMQLFEVGQVDIPIIFSYFWGNTYIKGTRVMTLDSHSGWYR